MIWYSYGSNTAMICVTGFLHGGCGAAAKRRLCRRHTFSKVPFTVRLHRNSTRALKFENMRQASVTRPARSWRVRVWKSLLTGAKYHLYYCLYYCHYYCHSTIASSFVACEGIPMQVSPARCKYICILYIIL